MEVKKFKKKENLTEIEQRVYLEYLDIAERCENIRKFLNYCYIINSDLETKKPIVDYEQNNLLQQQEHAMNNYFIALERRLFAMEVFYYE